MTKDKEDIEEDLSELSELEGGDGEVTGVATRVHVRPKRAADGGKRAAPRSRAKPAARDAAPKSKRAPRSTAAPSKGRAPKSTAPRSRRAPRSKDVDARGEVSIPPTWSSVNEDGDRVTLPEAAFADLTPLSPGIYKQPDEAASSVPALRPWLSPYMKAAAGLAAAVLCVLGARSAIHRGSSAPPPSAVAAQLADPPIAHVELIPPPPEEEAPPPPAPTESAADVKKAALAALEQGHLDDAVAAGEHASELDPTDAESWLILGAAYQDQGNTPAARRAFASCAKEATKGDVRECSFLLR